MTPQRTKIEQMLRDWRGEDEDHSTSPQKMAQRIDEEYEAYLATLPKQTAAILSGHDANERRVA